MATDDQLRRTGSFPLIRRTLRFGLRVIRSFLRNHGILLAGGVGYNILLSAVPLFAVLCVMLTHVVDEQRLLGIIALQVHHLAPTQAELLLDAVRELLDSRDIISTVGVMALLFFSSFAFRILEDAMAIIFHQPDNLAHRSFWVSALLPYAFILVLGAALMILTLLTTGATALNQLAVALFDRGLPLSGASGVLLNLFSFAGMVGLFSAIYKVLPVVKIALRRALVGGFVAALLWEGVRVVLAWYFLNISLVNVVYGSLGTLIVLLLSLEIGAVILLLGAQVIAELERSARADRPWHWAPGDPPLPRH